MTTIKQFFHHPRLWGLLCGLTLTLTLGLIQPARAQSVITGTIVAWGDNQYGQVTVPAGLSGVTAIAAGNYHSLALKSNGTVVAWGDNGPGQLNMPAGLSGVTAIAGGSYHSLALKSNGTVIAWGSNSSCESTVPGGLSGVIAIAGGGHHSLALKNDGTVVAWGCSGIAFYNRGQCNVPTELNNVTAIAAGVYHSLVRKSDGTVVAWGENGDGQSTVPAGLSGVVAIAAGESHSLALKNDGTVVAWGCGVDYGQCTIPTGLSGVTAIAVGNLHSLARKNDGTVVGWGWNGFGQLNIPAGLSGVTAIAGGSLHTLALEATDDGTPPTANPSQSPAATASGWTTSRNITVNWNWTDAGSGIEPTQCDISSNSGNALGTLTLTAFCVDRLGNLGSASYTLQIDPFAPSVVGTSSPAPNGFGWNNSTVTVSFTCADGGLSGVATNTLAGAILSSEGANQAVTNTGSCVDNAGNVSTPITVGSINIDLTKPTISAATTTQPNGNGWYNSEVTVRLTCADALSGTTPCPGDQLLSSEGTAVNSTSHTVLDRASNVSDPSNIVTVKIDKTLPVVAVTGVSNGASYTAGSVPTAACSTSDALSGVVTQATLNITGGNPDGTGNFTATCSGATDLAGNSTAGVSVSYTVDPPTDSTAPVITPQIVGTLGSNGWYVSDVTVSWTVVDAESAISSQSGCETQNVTSDTVGVTFTCAASSTGGSSSQSVTIQRDATAPTLTLLDRTAANSNGWNNTPVTLNWSCSDATADVYVGASIHVTLGGEGANQTETATCSDLAGNRTSDTQNNINIDKTAPTISAAATTTPNANGWYNSNVTVQFTCADNLSGVANCPAAEILSNEGSTVNSTAQTVSDLAGNIGDPSNVVTVQIDKTAPVVTVTGVSNGVSYTLGSVPTAGCNTSDALSGMATQATVNVTDGNPDGTGSFTATCSGASDRAGNSAASVSVSYTVTAGGALVGVCGGYEVRQVGNSYSAAGWSGAIKVGTSGKNTLNGGSGPDLLLGLGGNDKLDGKGGDDVLCGGDGVDLLLGVAGNDSLDGGNGNDVLNGGSGDYDELLGGEGNDTLLDGDGVRNVSGGAGNDLLTIVLRNGWRDRNGQARFSGLTSGYGNDVVGLAILNSTRFFVDISGDERDDPASPLEGNNDKLALGGVIDPASTIIKFEQMLVVSASEQTLPSEESGAEYLTEPVGEDSLVLDNTIFLPLVNR